MKVLIALSLMFTANAKILNYETTRTKSTAGTGVASILMNEATITNPAPLAFYNVSSLYFEKYSTERTYMDDVNGPKNDDFAIIASDSSKNLKGSISYVKTSSGVNEQKQFNLAFASLLGQQSSAGITYRNIRKQYTYNGEIIVKDYKQFVPGIFHAVNNKFSLGVVAVDPFRKNPNESKIIVGLQYQLLDFLTVMADGGADYENNFSDTSMIRGAAQLRLLSDFYLRFGAFEDKGLKEKGSGFGIGWVQPRLVIDFALRNIEVAEDEILQQDKEDIKESSFSLSVRF
jgi:hypothetical protein